MFVYEPSANVHFLKLLFLIRPLFLILLLITDLVTLVWTQVLWQRTRCTLFAGFLITYDGVRCRHTLGGEVYHSNHFFLFCFTFFIPCLKGNLPNQDIFSESNETHSPIPRDSTLCNLVTTIFPEWDNNSWHVSLTLVLSMSVFWLGCPQFEILGSSENGWEGHWAIEVVVSWQAVGYSSCSGIFKGPWRWSRGLMRGVR